MTFCFLPQIFLKLGFLVKREASLSSSFLHVRPTSAELPAGAHQRFFRINAFPASNVYQRKQNVTKLVRFLLRTLGFSVKLRALLGNLVLHVTN